MAGSGGSGGGSVGGGGGFSGGGFSGGGGFHSGGFHHGTFINTTRHRSFGSGGDPNGSGPHKPILKIGFYLVFGIIALSILSIVELNDFDDSYNYDDYWSEEITVSYEESPESYDVIEKDPLGSEYCIPINKYITDKTDNKEYSEIDGELKDSLKAFYKATGIEPHIYFLDYYYDGDLYEIALNKYYELFDDEGHLLLAFACDSYDYEYEIIIGDDTWEVLDETALDTLNEYINDEMFAADSGDFNDVAQGLSNAFSLASYDIMYEYIYIGNIVESVSSEDISEEAEIPSVDYVPDDYEQESVTDITPATTEKDGFEQFIEDEFGSHETTDELDILFDKIQTSIENISVSGIIAILAIVLVFVGAIAAVIIISKKRNQYEPDTFSNSSYDDFDKRFKKQDKKYDDFMK